MFLSTTAQLKSGAEAESHQQTTLAKDILEIRFVILASSLPRLAEACALSGFGSELSFR